MDGRHLNDWPIIARHNWTHDNVDMRAPEYVGHLTMNIMSSDTLGYVGHLDM